MPLGDLLTRVSAKTLKAVGEQFRWWGTSGSNFFEGARDQLEVDTRAYSFTDIERLLNIWTWRELMIGGRHLFQNFPIITGAVKEKSAYAIGNGWQPIFLGEDQEWGEETTETMMDWMRTCDMRGAPYSFWYSFFIGSLSLEHSGDFFILNTEDETGMPKLLFIEAHRIGQKFQSFVVPEGPYTGHRCSNGVIYDQFGISPIAYRYQADYWTEEVDLPAESIQHVFEPIWFSQGRGIPSLSHSMSDWDSVKETKDAEKVNVVGSSRINLLDYDATGRVDTGAAHVQRAGVGPDGRVQYKETITKGEIRHIQAGTGRKLEAFVANRPGTNTMAFLDFLMKGGFYGMEWPYEFGYNLKGLTGPAMRALTGKVQKTVNRRQNSLRPHVLRAYIYGLSRLMDPKIGMVKKNKEWFKWDFLMPPEVSIDGGRDAVADQKEYEIGLTNAQIYCGRQGLKWRKVYTQRAVEAAYKKQLVIKYEIDPTELGAIVPIKGTQAAAPVQPGGAKPEDEEEQGGDGEEQNPT